MYNPWPKSPVSHCLGLFLSCSLASSGQFSFPGEGKALSVVSIAYTEGQTSGYPCKPDSILPRVYLFLVTCYKLSLLPVLSLEDHHAFLQQLIFFTTSKHNFLISCLALTFSLTCTNHSWFISTSSSSPK